MRRYNVCAHIALAVGLLFVSGAAVSQVVDPQLPTDESCLKPEEAACPEGMDAAQCATYKATLIERCKELGPSWLEKLVGPTASRAIIDHIATILVALVGVIGAAVAAWLNTQKEHFKKLAERVRDPFVARPLEIKHYATNMIIIGVGGSGKTSIIHALSGADEAEPDVATDEVRLYSLISEVSIGPEGKIARRLTRIYVDDYVGQRFVAGITNEGLEKRREYVPSCTLVLVVDLFATKTRIDPLEPSPRFEEERVKYHIEQYPESVVGILHQLVGPRGQIILFINKVDLIEPFKRDTVKKVREAFTPLVNALERLRGVKFRVIVGSASKGLGIVGYNNGNDDETSLFKAVVDHAKEIDPQKVRHPL